MNTSRQGSSNYIISDAKTPIAFVYEETANFSYIGTWDNEVESIKPFWSLNHVIKRKNFYIHPTTTLTQRDHYDPRIYLFLGLLPHNTNWFIPWRFYKTIIIEIQNHLATLNINNTMELLRSLYQVETDHFLRFYDLLGDDIFNSC